MSAQKQRRDVVQQAAAAVALAHDMLVWCCAAPHTTRWQRLAELDIAVLAAVVTTRTACFQVSPDAAHHALAGSAGLAAAVLALLTGLLFTEDGKPYSSTHTQSFALVKASPTSHALAAVCALLDLLASTWSATAHALSNLACGEGHAAAASRSSARSQGTANAPDETSSSAAPHSGTASPNSLPSHTQLLLAQRLQRASLGMVASHPCTVLAELARLAAFNDWHATGALDFMDAFLLADSALIHLASACDAVWSMIEAELQEAQLLQRTYSRPLLSRHHIVFELARAISTHCRRFPNRNDSMLPSSFLWRNSAGHAAAPPPSSPPPPPMRSFLMDDWVGRVLLNTLCVVGSAKLDVREAAVSRSSVLQPGDHLLTGGACLLEGLRLWLIASPTRPHMSPSALHDALAALLRFAEQEPSRALGTTCHLAHLLYSVDTEQRSSDVSAHQARAFLAAAKLAELAAGRRVAAQDNPTACGQATITLVHGLITTGLPVPTSALSSRARWLLQRGVLANCLAQLRQRWQGTSLFSSRRPAWYLEHSSSSSTSDCSTSGADSTSSGSDLDSNSSSTSTAREMLTSCRRRRRRRAGGDLKDSSTTRPAACARKAFYGSDDLDSLIYLNESVMRTCMLTQADERSQAGAASVCVEAIALSRKVLCATARAYVAFYDGGDGWRSATAEAALQHTCHAEYDEHGGLQKDAAGLQHPDPAERCDERDGRQKDAAVLTPGAHAVSNSRCGPTFCSSSSSSSIAVAVAELVHARHANLLRDATFVLNSLSGSCFECPMRSWPPRLLHCVALQVLPPVLHMVDVHLRCNASSSWPVMRNLLSTLLEWLLELWHAGMPCSARLHATIARSLQAVAALPRDGVPTDELVLFYRLLKTALLMLHKCDVHDARGGRARLAQAVWAQPLSSLRARLSGADCQEWMVTAGKPELTPAALGLDLPPDMDWASAVAAAADALATKYPLQAPSATPPPLVMPLDRSWDTSALHLGQSDTDAKIVDCQGNSGDSPEYGFLGCWCRGCSNLSGDRERQLPLRFCQLCRLARYCSRTCQRRAWRAGHRTACQDWVLSLSSGEDSAVSSEEATANPDE